MKKLIIMAALTVAAFGFNQASAQKVIKDAAGAIYIDVQDMPAGTFSTTSLNVIRTAEHAGNSVFKKLQIAKADLGTMSWATACGMVTNTSTVVGQAQGAVNTGCKAYSAEGNAGKWRVPTMRELQLMYIMKDMLIQMGVIAFAGNYWTSTEHSANNSWYVSFNNGFLYNSVKATNNSTRCVREVTN